MRYGVTFEKATGNLRTANVLAKVCTPMEIEVNAIGASTGYLVQVSVNEDSLPALRAKFIQFKAVLDKEIDNLSTDINNARSQYVLYGKTDMIGYLSVLADLRKDVEKYINKASLWIENESVPKEPKPKKPVVVKVYKVHI